MRAGSVTVHSASEPPDVNVTVPVAPAGRPLADIGSSTPYATVGAAACAVTEVAAA